MFTLDQMLEIAKSQNVIFYKVGCPFCAASEKLMKQLKEAGILKSFNIYYLDKDFDNDTLLELVNQFGWQPESHQQYPSKPQIFINEAGSTEYIGGNFEFYKSRWNIGFENGKIELNGSSFEAPKLVNPMRF